MPNIVQRTVVVRDDNTVEVLAGWPLDPTLLGARATYLVTATSNAKAIEAALLQKQPPMHAPGSTLDITLDRMAKLLNTTHQDIVARAINTYAMLRTNTDTVFYHHKVLTDKETKLVVRRVALP